MNRCQWLMALLMFIYSGVWGFPANPTVPPLIRPHPDGSLSLHPAAENLLRTMASIDETPLPAIITPAVANDFAQKHCLRPAGKERWQLPATNRYDRFADSLRLSFVHLGYTPAVMPSLSRYDCVVILGATAPTLYDRIAFLQQLWQQGLRADNAVLLTGSRPLDLTIESVPTITKLASALNGAPLDLPADLKLRTEDDAGTLLWYYAKVAQAFSPAHFTHVVTPQIYLPEKKQFRRPNTKETIVQWVNNGKVTAGRYLFISNNPFIAYQRAVIINTLHQLGANLDAVIVDVVGPAMPANTKLGVLLDAFAKALYNEYHYWQSRLGNASHAHNPSLPTNPSDRPKMSRLIGMRKT